MLSKNKNFFKLNMYTASFITAFDYDFLLKTPKLLPVLKGNELVTINRHLNINFMNLLNVVSSNLIFKSNDLINYNDVNFAKIYFFLNRLFFGVFTSEKRLNFKFKRPKPIHHKSRQAVNKIGSNLLCYFSLNIIDSVNLRLLFSYYLYFLQPYSKFRQLPQRSNFQSNKISKNNSIVSLVEDLIEINLSVLDLSSLAAGSSSFYLFHDYFDWNIVQMFLKIKIKKFTYPLSNKVSKTAVKSIVENNKNTLKSVIYFFQLLTFLRLGSNHTN
jgi:hypothetical protein